MKSQCSDLANRVDLLQVLQNFEMGDRVFRLRLGRRLAPFDYRVAGPCWLVDRPVGTGTDWLLGPWPRFQELKFVLLTTTQGLKT